MWARAHLAHAWREEVRTLARSAAPVDRARQLVRQLRGAMAAAAIENHGLAGVLLKDYQRSGRNITTPLISPSLYLTGLNAGFEVVNANKSTGGANQSLFTTTNYWVALPGETLGN